MKIDLKTCSEEQLWKYVATELARNDVDVILVGGAVVSIYSKGAYKSGDLDFVINDFSRKKLDQVLMENLGFKKEGRFYKHSDCQHLFIEFATFPASIGDDYNIKPAQIESEDQIIKIFTPTDCVRDRLASFAYFNANECLDQALLVAKDHPVNLEKIRKWCESENIAETCQQFFNELKKKHK